MTRPLALITGASAGIGRELAREFPAHGYDLILTARRADELHKLADELTAAHGNVAHVIPADLSEPAAPASLYAEVEGRGHAVDVLVNNAGFGMHGRFAETDPGTFSAMLQLNVVALSELTRLFLPGMIARGRGRVLNVASIASFMPGPFMAGYYASKAYVRSLSEALSEELRGTGVTVSCLCPGPVHTEFASTAGMAGAKLFESPNAMTAEPVARAGYRATVRGRRVCVPGFLNRTILFAVRFLPKFAVLKMVSRLQEGRAGDTDANPESNSQT